MNARRRTPRRETARILLLGMLGIAAVPASAQTWIGSASGNWSAAGNWSGGVPLSSNTTSLTFNASGTQAWTATNDLVSSFLLNLLALRSRSSGTVTVASATGNSIQFAGVNATLSLDGPSSATISSPIALGANTTISGSGFGGATLSGIISGGGSLIINPTSPSLNAQQVTLSGANTFTGGVTLNSGILQIANNAALGTGTLTYNGGQIRNTTVTINNAIVANAALEVAGTAGSTLTLGATGSLTGSNGITLRALGSLTIQNAAAITGTAKTTFLNVGDLFTGGRQSPYSGGPLLTFSGASGMGLGLTSFDIQNNGVLRLDNSAGVNTNRISDTAPINLKEGFLTLNGNATLTSRETVGAINGEGYNAVGATPTSLTGLNVQLTAASLNRVNGGTFLFRGIGLGNAPGTGVGNIFFASAPTGDLVGGGGAAGSANISILPYAVGDSSTLGPGSSLVTYGANGIRPLASSEYATNVNTAGATDNVQLAAAATLSGSKTVNALTLVASNPFALVGSGTLALTSGTVLSANGNATNPTNTVSVPLDFGAREANVFSTAGTLALTQPLAGSGGFVKSGVGAIELTGNNAGLTGTLKINGGGIGFASDANLPGSGTIQMYGGSQTATGSMSSLFMIGTTPTTITRPLNVTGGAVGLGTGGNSASDVTFAGTISGDGGLRLLTGSNFNSITLTGNNTYTGPTSIWGKVLINGDAAFGNGGSIDFSGTSTIFGLKLLGDWTTNRLITTSSGSLFDTNGFNATLNGLVTGSGGFNKFGGGTLMLTGDNPYSGGIIVSGGVYKLSAAGRTLSASHQVNAGGALELDNAGTAQTDRINDGATNTLNAGEFRLVGNASTAVNELTGSLVLTAGSAGNVVTVAGNGASAILSFVTYTPNSAGVLFRGTNLGTVGSAQIFFNNLTVGQLLINALYDSSATGNGSGGTGGLAWYDPAVGVRKMLDSDFVPVGPAETFTAIQNSAPVSLPTSAAVKAIGAATTGAAGESNTIGALRVASDSTVAIASGTTLTASTGAILFDGGTATTQSISGGTLSAGTGVLAVTQSNTTTPATISSTLGGTGGLTKAGAGTLNLTGTYSTTGNVTVAGGTLDIGGIAGGTMVSGPVSVANGATLAIGAATLNPTGTTAQQMLTVNGTAAVNGLVKFTNGAGQTTVANYVGAGNSTQPTNFSLSATGGNTSVFQSNNGSGQALTLSGKISGGSAAASTVVDFRSQNDGTGVFKLTNVANDFQAQFVQAFSGVLAIDDDRQLGNAANGVRLNGGTLRADASLSTARPFTWTGVGGIDTNGNTLTLTGTLTSTGLTLNKTGAGTLIVAGTATGFGSLTNINAGSLAVNTAMKVGSSASTSNVLNVNSGGKLQGTGSVTPNSTSAGAKLHLAPGGTIAPGNSVGTLTLGNLLWDQGGILDFELGAVGASDMIVISNPTTANATFEKGAGTGTWMWNFTALSGFGAGSYTLVQGFTSTTFNGGVAGTLSPSEMGFTGLSGYDGTFQVTSNAGKFDLVFTTIAIPEPSSLALLALGGLGALSFLRRRRA